MYLHIDHLLSLVNSYIKIWQITHLQMKKKKVVFNVSASDFVQEQKATTASFLELCSAIISIFPLSVTFPNLNA